MAWTDDILTDEMTGRAWGGEAALSSLFNMPGVYDTDEAYEDECDAILLDGEDIDGFLIVSLLTFGEDDVEPSDDDILSALRAEAEWLTDDQFVIVGG